MIFDEQDPYSHFEFQQDFVRKVGKVLTRAEQLGAPKGVKDLAVTLKMLMDRPLNKYCVDKCQSAGWDVENMELRSFLWTLFTGCNSTFHSNEKVFGNIASNNLGKNGVISDAGALYGAATAPSLDDTGIQRICVPTNLPSEEPPLHRCEFNSLFKRPVNHKSKLDLSPLTAKRPTIHFQRAGPAAHRQLISASDFCVAHADGDLDSAEEAWRCRLFFEKMVIQRRVDASYYVSLGFSDWSFLGLKMTAHTQGSDTFLTTFGSTSPALPTKF